MKDKHQIWKMKDFPTELETGLREKCCEFNQPIRTNNNDVEGYNININCHKQDKRNLYALIVEPNKESKLILLYKKRMC